MLLGISGLSGSGKDTVADMLIKHRFAKISFADEMKRFLAKLYDWDYDTLWGSSENRNKPDYRYPRESHTWNGGKCVCCSFEVGDYPEINCYLTPRYALKQLGETVGRNCYKETWVNHTIKQARIINNQSSLNPLLYDYQDSKGLYLYVGSEDRPYPINVVVYDARYINELERLRNNDAVLIRVKREGYEKPKFDHKSETEQLRLDDDYFDFVIENDQGLEELEIKVKNLLKTII